MTQELDDVSIAGYAVFIKGLPTNVGVEEMQRAISTKMLKLYPVDQMTGKSVFIKARVIGDYNSLYKKCVKLKSQLDKLELIRAKNAESDER